MPDATERADVPERDWTEEGCEPMQVGCTGAPHRPACPERPPSVNELLANLEQALAAVKEARDAKR